MLKSGGIPIKDRGVRWKEAYSDKSLYLKKSYEEQVGPGSYFRWEGHDHTSGDDYYVVVTPGYSKKHGYHFFAALRKMPADHGASGKKFKTQGEALSYAYEHWRVPPPEGKPQRYTTDDLVNKPIVMENVHSALDAEMVKIATKEGKRMLIIDTTLPRQEKDAMALNVSGREGDIYPSIGPNEFASKCRYAAKASTVMGLGAAWSLSKQWTLNDKLNQGTSKVFNETGQETTSEVVPLLSQPKSPLPEQFDRFVYQGGIAQRNRLYEYGNAFKSSIDKGVRIKQPLYPDNRPGYKLTRLSDNVKNGVITMRVKLGQGKVASFNSLMNALQAGPQSVVDASGNPILGSDGQPQMGIPLLDNARNQVKDKNGVPLYVRDEKGNIVSAEQATSRVRPGTSVRVEKINMGKGEEGNVRGNYVATIQVPIDLASAVKAKISSIGGLPVKSAVNDNMVDVFESASKNVDLGDPSQVEKIMSMPVMEEIHDKGGALVTFDKFMMPKGIKIRSSQHIGKTSDTQGGAMPEVSYAFKPDAVRTLVAQAGGNLVKLRDALVKNQIRLTADMFTESQTAGRLFKPGLTKMPRIDRNHLPEPDENGDLVTEVRSMTEPWSIAARKGKVRIWDQEHQRENIVVLPHGVEPEQDFVGMPVITPDTGRYHLRTVTDPATGETKEEYHFISTNEWAEVDHNSNNRFASGNVYTIMLKPAFVSPKGVEEEMEEKEYEPVGFSCAYKETYVEKVAIEGPPGPKDFGKLLGIVMRDGTEIPFPEGVGFANGQLQVPPGVDPNDPGLQALNRPDDIVGHYVSAMRQHLGKPMSSTRPVKDSPLKLDRFERHDDGTVSIMTDPQGNPLPQLEITVDDLSDASTADNVYYKSMKNWVDYLQAKFGFSNIEMGWWADVDIDTLKVIWDKSREAKKHIAMVKEGKLAPEQLTEEEKMMAAFPEGKTIPPAFLKALAQVNVSNPDFFAPKMGKMWGVREVGGNWITDEPFASEERAEAFRDYMQQKTDAGQLEVAVREENAILIPNIQKEVKAGKPQPSLVHNTDVDIALEGFKGMEETPAEVPVPAGEAPSAETPAEMPTVPAAPEGEFEIPGAPEAAPEVPSAEPALEPVPVATQAPEPFLAPETEEQKKKPFLQPQPVDQEASVLGRLIKLANRLDEQGRSQEADAVDRLIQITLAKVGIKSHE